MDKNKEKFDFTGIYTRSNIKDDNNSMSEKSSEY